MQDRDEDLAWAYGEIERLYAQRVKFVITIVAMAAALAGVTLYAVKKK